MILGRYFVLLVLFVIAASGTGVGYYYWDHHTQTAAAAAAIYKTPEEADAYTRFIMEGFDIIQANYWQKASDADLSAVFLASVQKFASSTLTLSSSDRAGTAKLVNEAMAATPNKDKVTTAETILGAVLYNIAPVGRNQLLTQRATQDLHNEVNNVNPSTDLYGDLGVAKGASADQVQQAYELKRAELAASSSPQAAQELKQVDYAKTVLSDANNKANYDQSGVEPTVFEHLVNPSTLYVYIDKMSPETESEFEDAIRSSVKTGVTSMILDLRGNIGGDLTTSLTFLGLFSGPNEYAYDFFHRGEYQAQRTLGLGAMPELKQIREIAILTDSQTQSTAEVITAAMKRLHLAYSVGSKTRGWGSIEGQFPMQTQIDPTGQHEILLVVDLTVRDDAQPIEGNGVLPDVDTSDPQWKSKLSQYFFSPNLISAIKQQAAQQPQK